MPAFRINDAELAALLGEGADLFQLYVGALRPRMDFKTGIVGRRPGVRISYQALKEWTERAGRSGVKFLAHDKSKLQRMLARLQQLGLLRKMGGPYDLVFACPLADRDNCEQKQADTKSIQLQRPAKPRAGKGSRGLSTASQNAEVATHPASGITNTPPNPPRDSQGVHPPPHACGAGGELDPQHHQVATDAGAGEPQQVAEVGEKAITPPPHACGAGGEPGPQPPRATAQQPSEERHKSESGGGEGPTAQPADGGVGALAWEEDLAWPVSMTPEDRAYLARKQREVGEPLFQRVLDELRGAMASIPGGIKDHWAYFHTLLRNAQEKGDTWQTVYAEKVALARQKVAQTMARQQADDAAFAAALPGAPGYPGAAVLRQLARGGGAR